MIKPRLKSFRPLNAPWWECAGDGVVGVGISPADAYRNWEIAWMELRRSFIPPSAGRPIVLEWPKL